MRRRSRRGGINWQRILYNATLPATLFASHAANQIHKRTRRNEMETRSQRPADDGIPAYESADDGIFADDERLIKSKPLMIIVNKDRDIKTFPNWEVIYTKSVDIINRISPDLVLYWSINVTPWNGRFIDYGDKTKISEEQSDFFPCFIIEVNHFKSYKLKKRASLLNKGYYFVIDPPENKDIFGIVMKICKDKMTVDEVRNNRKLHLEYKVSVYAFETKKFVVYSPSHATLIKEFA